MSMILTPCLPHKECKICESRLFPVSAPPAKRAAKFAHQAANMGARIRFLLALGTQEDHTMNELRRLTIRAAGFARLALAEDPGAALKAA